MSNASRTVRLVGAGVVPWAALVSGCISHSVKSAPIEIKPIYITMDINLRVQGELDEFFDFEESAEAVDLPPAAGPTTGKQ